MDRAKLINAAAGANENYRIGDCRELELGFLYGTAELITTLTLGPDESYSDAREAIARQIDLEAATGTYPLLSINGGPGRVATVAEPLEFQACRERPLTHKESLP